MLTKFKGKTQMKKAILSYILTVAMILSAVTAVYMPVSAGIPSAQTQASGVQSDFSLKVSKIIHDNWSANYFSSISLKVGDNTMLKDGHKITVPAPVRSNGKIWLPVTAVGEALGKPVHVKNPGGFGGELIRAGNGYTADNAYIDSDETNTGFNVQTNIDGDTVTISDPYQTKELIVGTQNGCTLSDLEGATQYADDGSGTYFLQYTTEDATIAAEQVYESSGDVTFVEPNGIVHIADIDDPSNAQIGPSALSADISTAGLPTDPTFKWGTERISANEMKAATISKNIATTITVAVLDTGLDSTHPFLSGRYTPGINELGGSSTMDDNGHGTHVSGTIVDCTTANVKIMPVKVLDSAGYGDDLEIAQGIRYAADHGVSVINMSLGGPTDGSDTVFLSAVNYAIGKGVTVVVAAGNDGGDTQFYVPARFTNCVTVAATDISDNRPAWSNYGSAVDVAAPGVNIYSTLPSNSYGILSGTSMATPHVAACAAMLKLNNASWTPAQIHDNMHNYTDKVGGATGFNVYYGYGIVNMAKYLGITVPVSGVAMSQSSIDTSIVAGYPSVTPLSAWISPLNATNRALTYSTTDASVATFNGSVVTAYIAGTATVTAKASNGMSANCMVTVNVQPSADWIAYAASSYAGGNGTAASPYLITTPQQMAKLDYDVVISHKSFSGQYFKLNADIDLSGHLWTPTVILSGITAIGGFSGTFDGNGHSIENYLCSNSGSVYYFGSYCGIFGFLDHAAVKNFAVNCIESYGNGGSFTYDGVLAGYCNASTIINCYTTGGSGGAGFVGYAGSSTITNCFSTADCTLAGFIGYNDGSTITNCYASGLAMSNHTSAFAGTQAGGLTANCFAAGLAPSGIGFTPSQPMYATGANNVKNCYYLNENTVTDMGTPAPFSFFQNASTYVTTSNWNSLYPWDFTNTWAIDPTVNGGLPYLKNMPVPPPNAVTGTWLDYAAGSFGGGTGTRSDPYLISTPEQLARLTKIYQFGGADGKWFRLTNDMDLSAHAWYAVGRTGVATFGGNIVGNGKTISGLQTDSLLYRFSGGTIDGVTLSNVNVICAFDSLLQCCGGAIAVIASNCSVTNCTVTGTVTGSGGMFGTATYTDIIGCAVDVNVSSQYRTGGIVGQAFGGAIRQCRVSGSVASLSGWPGAIVSDCQGDITDCYAKDITGVDSQGLVNSNKATIAHCYFAGQSKYYLYNNVMAQSARAAVTSDALTQLPTFDGWDFSSVWAISSSVNDGMPYFSAQTVGTVCPPTTHWTDYAASAYAGGSGTQASPYLISTPEQLAKMAADYYLNGRNVTTYYKLLNNIDMSGHLWDAFSNNNAIFGFDGNHMAIFNLTGPGSFMMTLSDSGFYNANLYIKNLGFISMNMGGEIVYLNYGLISGCYTTGLIKDIQNYIGGIAGDNEGVIDSCYSSCTLESSYPSGYVPAGGIAANNSGSGLISNCYFNGTVFGSNATLISQNTIGGGNTDTITNCYASGRIIGLSSPVSPTTNNVYYNYDLFSDYISGMQPLTTAQMKQQASYQTWDFSTIWAIDPTVNDGYPYLRGIGTATVSYTPGPDGAVVSKTVVPSTVVSVTADTSNAGYAFTGWYAGTQLLTLSPVYTFIATQTVMLTAQFTAVAPGQCLITAAAITGGTVAGGGMYTEGDSVTLTAVPTTRYTFDGWYENNIKVSPDASYTFTAAASRLLQARFIPNQYTVTVTVGAGGTASGGIFHYGDSVILTAVPNTGYAFDGWYENNIKVSASATYIFTATSDRTLQARFTVRLYTTVNVTAQTGGSVTGGGTYHYGNSVTVIAMSNAGYGFAGWYEAGAWVSSNGAYTFTASADRNLQARFGVVRYPIDIQSSAGCSTSGSGIYAYGTTATLICTPEPGLIFDGWYENNIKVSSNTTYSFTVTDYRSLEARCGFSISVTAGTGGSASGGGIYAPGTYITVTAAPSSGYTFDGWYEGSTKVTSSASYSFYVTVSRTLQARFVKSAVPSAITSPVYPIANGYIRNILPGTTVAAFLTGIDERAYVKVYNGATEVTGTAFIGTGMTVKLMNGSTVLQTLTAVVKGDLTGGGTTSALGLLKLKRDILGIESLTGAFKLAADINGDGVVNALDLLIIKRDILGIEKIK